MDGGTISGTNKTEYTIETDTFTLIQPTKSKYNFIGWTGTDLSSATKSVSIANGSTGNRIYTATWKLAQIIVMNGWTLQGDYVGATPNMRTIQDCSSFAALYSRITNGTGWEMGCHPVNYSGGFYTTLNKPVNLTGISTISFTINSKESPRF